LSVPPLPIPSRRATSDGRRPLETASLRTRSSARSKRTRPPCLCPLPDLELSQSCWWRMAAQSNLEFNFSRSSLDQAAPSQQLLPQLQQLLLQQQLHHLHHHHHHLQLLLLHLQLLLLLLFPPLHLLPHLAQQRHWHRAPHPHQCHQELQLLEQLQC